MDILDCDNDSRVGMAELIGCYTGLYVYLLCDEGFTYEEVMLVFY